MAIKMYPKNCHKCPQKPWDKLLLFFYFSLPAFAGIWKVNHAHQGNGGQRGHSRQGRDACKGVWETALCGEERGVSEGKRWGFKGGRLKSTAALSPCSREWMSSPKSMVFIHNCIWKIISAWLKCKFLGLTSSPSSKDSRFSGPRAGPRNLHLPSTVLHHLPPPCTDFEAGGLPLNSLEGFWTEQWSLRWQSGKRTARERPQTVRAVIVITAFLPWCWGWDWGSKAERCWVGTLERMWELITYGVCGEAPLVLLAQVTREVMGGVLSLRGGLFFSFVFWGWVGLGRKS